MLTIRLASETREVITETQIVVLLLTLALFALVYLELYKGYHSAACSSRENEEYSARSSLG